MAGTAVAERGYAQPELLAETDWLAQHLNDAGIRIVDTRAAAQYEAGHIPGAVSLAAAGAIPRAENGDMGDPAAFADLAGKLGIGDDTEVVVYDAPAAAMGMFAWTLLYHGHQKTRMLDGGFAKWTAEGRPVSTEPATYPQAEFHPQPVEGLYCSLETARASHGAPKTVFWDVRSQGEYDGTAGAGGGGLPPRPGHIAGAVHLEWTELLDPEARTFKPADELRMMLESRGITPDVEVHAY
jgi:thiosulfate/3-mercaptopyruvate sulfurtransferase